MSADTIPHSSGYMSTISPRLPWGSSAALSTGPRARPIEVNVNELRAMQGTASSKSVVFDGPNDAAVLSKEKGRSVQPEGSI